MKPSRITLFASLLLIGVTTVGTLHAQPVNNRTVTSRIDSLERNVQLLQRQIARGELPEGVEPSEAAAANLQSQLDEIREDMQKLRGELEQSQFLSRQVKEQMDRMNKDLEFRLNQLEQKSTGTVMPTPAHTDEPLTDEPQPADDDTQAGVTDAAQSEFESPRAHYNYAFRLLNQAKYDDAGKSFADFVKAFPKDPLTGNAYYWLGETHYVRRDYVKAADSFRQGFEAMPSGPKAADNLLKLAMSLDAMKREKESCVVLKQLVAKFGASSETIKQKAEQEISRIGCQ